MVKQYNKLITLIIILLAIPNPAWYAVNYYAAGLVDQTHLIEYGMQDDFIYCNDWRPELFDPKKKISGYYYINKTYSFNEDEYSIFSLLKPQNTLREIKQAPLINVYHWTYCYNYHTIFEIIKQENSLYPEELKDTIKKLKVGMTERNTLSTIRNYYPNVKLGRNSWSSLGPGHRSFLLNEEWSIKINYMTKMKFIRILENNKKLYNKSWDTDTTTIDNLNIEIKNLKSKLLIIRANNDWKIVKRY